MFLFPVPISPFVQSSARIRSPSPQCGESTELTYWVLFCSWFCELDMSNCHVRKMCIAVIWMTEDHWTSMLIMEFLGFDLVYRLLVDTCMQFFLDVKIWVSVGERCTDLHSCIQVVSVCKHAGWWWWKKCCTKAAVLLTVHCDSVGEGY